MKRLPVIVLTLLAFALFYGCSSAQEMKIDADPQQKTFSFVDVKSGQPIRYSKLIIDGKEVVATYVTDNTFGTSVAFGFTKDSIVTDGSTTTINDAKGITEHATLEYTLKDDVLTVVKVK